MEKLTLDDFSRLPLCSLASLQDTKFRSVEVLTVGHQKYFYLLRFICADRDMTYYVKIESSLIQQPVIKFQLGHDTQKQ